MMFLVRVADSDDRGREVIQIKASDTKYEHRKQVVSYPWDSDNLGRRRLRRLGETNITHAACAYPITSSTTMGTAYQTEVSNGKKNLWGDTILFIQPESEHSAASSVRRALRSRAVA